MTYCNIKNPPVFELQIDKWSKTTKDNGAEMAVAIEALFNNTLFNKAMVEKLEGRILNDITIPVSDWSNLTYTILDPVITPRSSITIGFAFDNIPTAQKANIRGRTENGRLVLVAKKLPATDLLIEELRILNFREEV